ncbi:hypothetical protein CTAYLR_000061 [Chrysophaeum taylorii]|uniref:Glucose-6-phosphate 1-dehydrogenase n=1 Tax=Chrysophaeum taylorii TaxID=2483200 RepID=A0AAD7XQU2_9STRA|nr:hypothetical protein CTAYLR_000061 [Chrysophaeum taylorii]
MEDVEALRLRVKELEDALKEASTPFSIRSLSTGEGVKKGVSVRTTIVLFGADGNLATKKTYPTLFALWRRGFLPRTTLIVGYAREPMSAEVFRRMVFRAIYNSGHAQTERNSFLERCHYVSGQFDCVEHFGERLRPKLEALEAFRDETELAADSAAASEPPTPNSAKASTVYPSRSIASSMNDLDAHHTHAERLRVYYLAVPPFLYGKICACLNASGARAKDVVGRFVLEKPFGRDLKSCRALCHDLGTLVREDEAFRIDHYLGKELVMNVLVLRFANVCFEAIWSRSHVARVEVCCLESIGTAGRGGYFDSYGIIRDVMQNHLAQIMALVAMEQPLSFGAEDIRREKVKVLRGVRALDAERDLVVGQYDGYVDDDSVSNKKSKTETFAAARLYIDNPRWAGVPFVLTAAKAVSQKKVEVRIIFHKVAGAVAECSRCDANELVVRVQPDECIYWRVQNRVPGLHSKLRIEPRRMNLLYTPAESRGMPEAYERLLLEVLRGDATNFVSVDELDAAWRIFTPALNHLSTRLDRPERYAYGSDGPCTRRLFRPQYPDEDDDDDDDLYNPPSPHSLHILSRR